MNSENDNLRTLEEPRDFCDFGRKLEKIDITMRLDTMGFEHEMIAEITDQSVKKVGQILAIDWLEIRDALGSMRDS